ncbi:MAG: TonB family protein [Deltaproteobacteria bacterium]|nr:MAG: TonB family protein [Deltaproteobacteria bacterium]
MSRRWLVAVSVVAHLAIVVGLVISGIWRIDQVERGRIRSQPIGVPLPPPPPPGGQVAKSDPVKPETKGAVTVVRTPHQPKPSVVAPQPPGGDEPPGEGSGSAGVIGGTCHDAECGEAPPAPPVCGNGVLETGEQCDDGNAADGDGCSSSCRTEAKPPPEPRNVVPSVLQGLRISGETQLHPSTVTQNQMLRDNASRVQAIIQLCLDTGGRVASARVRRSTGYDEYDRTLLAAVGQWLYRPYMMGATPVPACSTVTFIYAIH